MSMGGILATIVIGFVIGLIARALKPGDDNLGIVLTTALGVAGSIVATYAGQALGLYAAGQAAGFVGAVVGAIALLAVVSRLKR
jgi:uncharacterized membrane protein YeaQ/YmgE (transglycosylase-associated protein family)